MADSLITDEVRALIGTETPPERNRFAISEEMIYDLADATEDPNPLYVDREAAESSRFGDIICPPLATWKDITPPIGYFGAGQESHFEVPLPFNSYGLNGGSDWQFLRPPYVGSWITRQFKILDIFQKRGRSGPLVFVERLETQTDQHDQMILLARRVSIHRALDQDASAPQQGAMVASELHTVNLSPPGPGEEVLRPAPSDRPQLYFEDVSDGMALPPVVKGPLTTTHLVRWAAANGNYARIHWDLPFAQMQQGLENVVVNGSLKNQYLGQLLVDFAGPGGWLRRFYVQHRGMDYPGDVLTANGIVTGLREVDGVGHADCTVTLTNSRGHQTASGVGTVALPRRGQELPLVWGSGGLALLDGLRVLDMGPGIAPSFCAKLLADYGADVVKVEPPGKGDPVRGMGPFVDDDPHPEKSIPFLYLNTGKRGVTLDYSGESGRGMLSKLLDNADVLVEGFAPSEAEESAIGYKSLSKSHPKLVVTSVTPFGQDGPYRDFQATDIITCAMSGLMYHSGDSDKEPLRNALDQALYVAGANAAAATLVAVFAQMATGEGQQVDVSVAECLAAHLVQPVPYYNYMGATKGRRPVRGSGFEELMPARDGYVVPSVQGSQPWETVADLIGLEELHDPRFASGAGRIAHGEELKALLVEGLAQWDRLPLFLESGERRLVFGMAQDAGDLVACPHLEARGFFRDVEHPVAGRAAYAGMGARLLQANGPVVAERPAQAPAPAPLLGQHNAEIYGDELGYGPGELAALRYAGVI